MNQGEEYVHGRAFQICGRLHFSVHADDCQTETLISSFPALYFCSSTTPESYLPFCADFGPNDICSVLEFCQTLYVKMGNPLLANRPIVYYSRPSAHAVTNTVFLLCCYLMLEEGYTPSEAVAKFANIGLPILPYQDATWHAPTFSLSIVTCLRGLSKAISLGLLDVAAFDPEAHLAYYEAESRDISRVHPKFVAFATPKSVADEHSAVRRPQDHTEPFARMGVTDVVRLSEEGIYDDADFVTEGFTHHVLEFEDCTSPTPDIVRRFLDICDGVPGDGVVAVHCLAGLGRTGTLIACYMIKNQGFTAGEAIGYLRLMRPGSIIGPQQHFLEAIEGASWDGNTPVPGDAREEQVQELQPSGVEPELELAGALEEDFWDAQRVGLDLLEGGSSRRRGMPA